MEHEIEKYTDMDPFPMTKDNPESDSSEDQETLMASHNINYKT